MFRQNTYNESDFSALIPVHRQMVVPGESLEIDALVNWETAPFLRNLLTGGVASLYTFYCPFRLVWDQWIDFIGDPESGLTVPQTGTAWGLLFESPPAGETVNALFRRGYKLAFNQFFGSDQFGNWYDDVNLDTDVTRRPLRGLDQFQGKFISADQVADEKYVAPVTGTSPNQVATISLNDFRQQMKQARSSRRADMTGDKYVDAMLRMGVKLDWRVQLAPELIGMMHQDFEAKETRSSYTPADPAPAGAAITGQAFARYAETMRYKVPRKFFAEHGYVFTCLAVRPFSWNNLVKYPIDSQQKTYTDFWLGDNQAGVDRYPSAWFWSGAAAQDRVLTPRFQYLLSGQNLKGDVQPSSWFQSTNPANITEAVFPVPQTGQSSILTQSLAAYGRFKVAKRTPVRASVF